MTQVAVPISSKHFDKDARGRWVLLFGRYDGKLLTQVPSSYLRWMLDNCRFVRGNFRTRVGQLLQQQYTGIVDEPCLRNDPGGDPSHGDVGFARCECDGCRRDEEDADWMHDEGFGDR